MNVTSGAAGVWQGPESALCLFVKEQSRKRLEGYCLNPGDITEHAAIEQSIIDGGYGHRQMFELIQNAADAIRESGNPGGIEVHLTGSHLYCANEGLPLDEAGANSILHSHVSTKRSHEIGHFGLGFKSVLGISQKIDIFSRMGSFRFDTGDARMRILASIPGYTDKTPGLRLAEAIQPDSEFESDELLRSLSDWATTVIRLSRDLPRSMDLSRDIENFPSEFLLFSPHVSRLRLIDDVKHEIRTIELATGKDGEIFLDDTRSELSRWRVFRDIHQMSEVAKNDAGEATARDEVEVAWAVPLERRAGKGQYWAFFPTTYESSLTGILNAPWKTNSDRQGLLEGFYNTEIIDAASQLIAKSLVSLFEKDDPGAHLDLLPARPEDAEGWANRELTARVYQRTAEEMVLPDSERVLQKPSNVRLLPVQAGDRSLELWRGLETRPQSWGHERLNLRERRPRAVRLGAVNGGVDEWLEAIAEPGTSQASIEAIVAAEGCSSDIQLSGRVEKAGRHARIVLTADNDLVLPDPSVLFLNGTHDTGMTGLSMVQSAVEGHPVARRVLVDNFGIKQVDPLRELEVLLSACETPDFDRWDQLWGSVRRTEMQDATPLLRRNRHHLRVRTLDGSWKQPWEVLLPGPIVPADGSRDSVVAVDVVFHSADVDALQLLRVVAEPTSNGLTREEFDAVRYGGDDWQWKYRSQAAAAFQSNAQAKTNSAPQWAYVKYQFVNSAGPLAPFSHLSPTSKQLYAEKLLVHACNDAPWTWHHETRRDFYPDLRSDSPAQWLIRTSATIPTSLGPKQLPMCVGRNLQRWEHFLPVTSHDGDFLRLPQTLSEIPNPVLEATFRLVLDLEDVSETGDFYAALASAGCGTPRLIQALSSKGPVRVSPTDATVTHDALTARLLQEEHPVVLVATANDEQSLITEWGLKPVEAFLETTVSYEPSKPGSPLVDEFPALPSELLAEYSGIELVPCETIWKEFRTLNGTRRTEMDECYKVDEKEFLYRDGLDEEDLLRSLLACLHLELSEQTIERVLRYNQERTQDERVSKIFGLSTLEEKLGVMLGQLELRRLLPQELVEDVRVDQQQVDERALARMVLAISGTATLIRCRDELERAGFNPPHRWAGGEAALRFVRALGFPDEFAGSPARVRWPFIDVDGPVKLPNLHGFQERIAANIATFLDEDSPGRGLVSLPTGAGKTRVVTESLVRAYRAGRLAGCVMWLADRGELCEQAVQSWREVWRAQGPEEPLRISRLWGETNDRVEDVRQKNHVVVATFQSLVRRIEQTRYDWLRDAACVVIDEAHGSVTPSYTKILEQYELTARQTARPLVGLTATPFRGRDTSDGSETERLVRRYGGRRFDHGVFDDDDPYPLLREEGVLSNAEFEVLEGVSFELSGPELEQFQQFDRLPANVEARLGLDRNRNLRIVEGVAKLPPNCPTLVFATSIDHAELLAALLAVRGIKVRAISSRTDVSARRQAIEDFKAGAIQVLTNYGILTTGFDAPKIEALFVARPIYSPGLYMQVVGRGLRGPANGGTESCLIVNVEDNLLQYGSELAFRQFERLWKQVRGDFY